MHRSVIVFIVVVFGLSVSLGLLIGSTGGHDGRFAGLAILSMFLPAVAVLVASGITHDPVRVTWSRFPLHYVPVAVLLIPVVLHVVMLTMTGVRNSPLPWQAWLAPQADGLYHAPISRGWGVLTGGELAARIGLNAVAGLLIVSALAWFEEIGWRGWLLPRLVEGLGARRAVVLTSILWGVWHAPFALSGAQHVDGVSPERLALLVPLGTTAAGLVIGWLWLRTESIWIVALAHGALNNWGQYAFKYMRDFADPTPTELLTAGFAALLLVGCALVAYAPERKRGDGDNGGQITTEERRKRNLT